jgi:hypothetical protein
MSVADATVAQDTRYRVEILVLQHLEQNEEPLSMPWIQDYSQSIDFLTPPPEEDPVDEAELATMEEVPPAADPYAADALAASQADIEEPAEIDPNAVIPLEEMSDTMQEAWRRLRLSGPFRPEQYLSWEQGRTEPFPLLRMHDLDIVRTDDPYAELRKEREEAAENTDEPEASHVFADAAGLDELQGAMGEEVTPELPDPTVFYRLDGTVMLRRTRFLHLDIDLQLREAVYALPAYSAPPGSLLSASPQPTQPQALENEDAEPTPREPSSYLIHAFKQSRQVKSGRMEYFDGPVLGVLAFITTIEAEPEESPR